jgi:hypothetical protein
MDNSDWARLTAACDDMREFMRRHEAGDNPQALRQGMAICFRMTTTSTYANGCVRKVERELGRYFSARRWADHARGAEGVRYEIAASLARLRSEAVNRMGQQE